MSSVVDDWAFHLPTAIIWAAMAVVAYQQREKSDSLFSERGRGRIGRKRKRKKMAKTTLMKMNRRLFFLWLVSFVQVVLQSWVPSKVTFGFGINQYNFESSKTLV